MNKFLSFIVLAVASMLAACSDEVMLNPGSDISVPDGTPIEISSAIEIPEMYFGNGHNSRILKEEIDETYLRETLQIHLFVFDKTGSMRQFIEPRDIQITSVDVEKKTAYFLVKNIYASSEPRTLHFVILPKKDKGGVDDLRELKGGEYIDMMANEKVVMPALQIGNQTDAYWGRVEVDNIANRTTVALKAVRNFAKIIVSTVIDPEDEKYGYFEIDAYAIVNKPAHSLIAPYITKNHLFAEFYDDSGLKNYDDVKNQGFNGINPSDANDALFCNTVEEVANELEKSNQLITGNTSGGYKVSLGNSAYYIYEHQQSGLAQAASSAKVTYLIIRAKRNGNTYYYKVDIGYEDQGKFYYYDIIRNFQYTIQINAVTGNGASSLAEAMQGAAVNNLTASIVTRDLFSIGYENDKIEVSNTRAFITSPNATHTFQFRYTINDGTVDPSKLKIYDFNNEDDPSKHYNMKDNANGSDLENLHSAYVIKNASIKQMADGWYELTFTTGNLPSGSERYEQTLKVLYEGGSYLARTFTIMLRQPWQFENVTEPSGNVGAGYNQDISIQFTLPDGLSQTQFPIVVTFESDKQNIYAVPGQDLTVNYVKSGFNGATTDNVISYERRFEYEEYVAQKTYTVNFKTNTTSAEDKAYNTASIETQEGGRTGNNDSPNFCIRMGDRNPDGMKYLKPLYINYTRTE